MKDPQLDHVSLQKNGDSPDTVVTTPPKEPEHVANDGTVRKDHYGMGRQPWDDIVDFGWGAPFAAGNALKYVRRFKQKNGADDLEKGRWYYARLYEMSLRGSHYATTCREKLIQHCSTEEMVLLENKAPDNG